MSRKRSKTKDAVVMPLRVPQDMQKQIRTLSDRARLSDADIMRMAIDRGLAAVEKIFAKSEEQAA